MGRRSHTRVLDIWMNGELVGQWRLAQGQDELHYAPDWAHSPHSRPLSLSLPLLPGNRPHKGPTVRAFFDNLLPDSAAIRQRLVHRYGAVSADPFDMLEQIGRDCAGALMLLPHGAEAPNVRMVDAEPLDEQGVARILAGVTQSGARIADAPDDLRISIAGAQEKTALLWHNGQWHRPLGATPTTHIIKLPLGLIGGRQLDMSHSVENEWLCAQILRAYGLPVAETTMASFAGQKVLVVERFDRRWSDDSAWIMRIPQEDMCQATGTPPGLKYESDGGPGIEKIMALLQGSRTSARDREQFLEAQILFWLLCAPDGHAKNFSLRLLAGGDYELTPLYDVLSAYPLLGKGANLIAPHDVKLAMAVRSKNAHWHMNKIMRRHWNAMARRCGCGTSAEKVIQAIIAQTPSVLAGIYNSLPTTFPAEVAESILKGLKHAVERLASMPAD
ncbi:MAG: type II toxin-antitoxin system HipA family toxin [Zoogloea oleivorans]|jgi:serine/threonine-protein kinase HipA|uniref:type II toxin-antitoxin system HipA family toxin n=1 Tax=Zoogloea oleivorans TaxID=1552750 RepID=UPI002A37064E|nr:type II toxin-antitoxin system HipA family toxin [Zoogloea oleivorans]MDY0037776.1 type II toxin-antitoxin system HipA family toxin [Zoogloea oleivorans]